MLAARLALNLPRMPEFALPTAEASQGGTRDWPHAPPHRLAESGVFCITARCRSGRPLLSSEELKHLFVAELRRLAAHYGWTLEAWCVLPNHYHLVAHAPANGAANLGAFLRHLHGVASREKNRRDGAAGDGRHWHNYWETRLTGQRGYLARLNYVHANAVHHRLVAEPAQWEWSSAAYFERAVSPAWARTIYGFLYAMIARNDGD